MTSRVVQAKVQTAQTQRGRATEAGVIAGRRPAEQPWRTAAPGPVGLPWNLTRIPAAAPRESLPVGPRHPPGRVPLLRPIQAKLEVGAIDDPLERQADELADRVVRMRDPARLPVGTDAVGLRRKCACGGSSDHEGECEGCRQARGDRIQRLPAQAGRTQGVPPIVHEVLQAPGQPLDRGTRAFFESRFGHEFSSVRVHTDARAAESARAVNAAAYTVGRQIVFGPGRYAPATTAGLHILAHELTHVIQQGNGRVSSVPDRPVSSPLHQADPGLAEHPDRAVAGAGIHASRTTAPVLQRQLELTCSIDPLKAAKVLRGDKSAALDVLNCCEKGLGPLPEGCSKDLIDAARKLLGGGGGKGQVACPPGFHPGGSKEFAKLCCREGATTSAQNCCPPDRIAVNATAPRCCPEGQSPDAGKKNCVTPPPFVLPLCPPDSSTPLLGCLCFPPSRQNFKEKVCCPEGQEGSTGVCEKEAPKPKPQPQPVVKPPPGPIVINFQFDRPRVSETGVEALGGALTAKGREQFDTLVGLLQANPDWKVQLTGKASPEGTDEYNMSLSTRRARLIERAIEAKVGGSRTAPDPGSVLPAGCQTAGPGVFACGEIGATGESDRQVEARIHTSGQAVP